MTPSGSSRKRTERDPQGDLALRDRMVLDNLGLVKAIAARIHERVPPSVDFEDLTHAGIVGLIHAATHYDPTQQPSFAAYANFRIRGAILDHLRQLDWASRQARRRQRQLAGTVRDLTAELHRTPTDSEVAARLGCDEATWREMMLEAATFGPVSADTRAAEEGELPAPQYAASPETQPEHICSQVEMQQQLEHAMKKLRDNQRAVLTMYYMQDMTMKEIGRHLGVNESRVSQIHSDALRKMQAALSEAGIRSPAAF